MRSPAKAKSQNQLTARARRRRPRFSTPIRKRGIDRRLGPKITDDLGEVTAFVVKIALVVAIIGVLAVEFGSPFITRVTLDNDAQAIVQDAAHDYTRTSFDEDATIERLRPRLEEAEIELREFEVKGNSAGDLYLEITLAKPAISLFAHRIDSLADFYDVEATASAPIDR